MRLIIAGLLMMVCGGCAVLDVLLEEEPVPVCDKDAAGVQFGGKTCIKFSDGSYRWE